jgi:hypothetical protein
LLDTLPEGDECARRGNDTIPGNGISCKPRMIHYVFKVGTAGGIRDEHQTEYISCLGRYVVWEGEWGVDDVFVQQVDVVAVWVGGVIVEGEVAGEHGV